MQYQPAMAAASRAHLPGAPGGGTAAAAAAAVNNDQQHQQQHSAWGKWGVQGGRPEEGPKPKAILTNESEEDDEGCSVPPGLEKLAALESAQHILGRGLHLLHRHTHLGR